VRAQFGGEFKASIVHHLEAARCLKDPVLLESVLEHRLTTSDQPHCQLHPPIPAHERASGSAKIFAIRKKEDCSVVTLWNMCIIPVLPKLLDEPMKTGYTACLVREGTTFESATPIIRIASPQPPGQATRDNILTMLDKACGMSLQSLGIRVHFYTGSLILLSGDNQWDENVEDTENDDYSLPLHNTYWKHAGMGASIGLLCTNTEFATLGCYVNVDGEKFILTVDHFIPESYKSLDNDREADRMTLTSPAIAKVNSMRTYFEQSFSRMDAELQAKVKNIGSDLVEPADLDDPAHEHILKLAYLMDRVKFLLNELQEEEIGFKIGSLSTRCKSGSLAPLSLSHSTVKHEHWSTPDLIELGLRLDWALFEVDPASSRKGRNRYRHKQSGHSDFFLSEAGISDGEGDICRQTWVVEGNETVRFFAGDNGFLEGQVNGTLQVVRDDKRTTLEHHIVMCPKHVRSAMKYAGASGTMVVKVPDNEILGMVWGCNKDSGQPVFTPIHTIFEDIGKVLQTQHVKLDQYPEVEIRSMPIAPAPASNVLLVSGSERYAPKLLPLEPSKIPQPPLAAGDKTRLWNKYVLPLREHKARDVLLEIDTADTSEAQAPSLSSSRASSPGFLPPTPALKPSRKRFTSDSESDYISIIGEDSVPSLVLDEGDDIIEVESLHDLLGHSSTIENKSSIQFLGGRLQKSVEYIFSSTPKRWNTWPVNPARPWKVCTEQSGQLEIIA
jgi:hypothetical protein